jgi:hypothetical protein
LATQSGFGSFVTANEAALGKIELSRRRPDVAAAHFVRGLEFAQRQHRPAVVLECLDGLFGAAAFTGNFAAAARLYGAVETLHGALGHPRPVVDQGAFDEAVAELRRSFVAESLAAEWNAGSRMTLSQTAAFALELGSGQRLALGNRFSQLEAVERAPQPGQMVTISLSTTDPAQPAATDVNIQPHVPSPAARPASDIHNHFTPLGRQA